MVTGFNRAVSQQWVTGPSGKGAQWTGISRYETNRLGLTKTGIRLLHPVNVLIPQIPFQWGPAS